MEIKTSTIKEIINLRISENDSMLSLQEKFYEIVRKAGIKRGEKIEGGGIAMNSPEWHALETIFLSKIQSEFSLFFMLADTPEDIIS